MEPAPGIPPALLELLACPVCMGDVRLEVVELRCVTCGRRYPIVEGIPIMVVDEDDAATARLARQAWG
jgi:uncharacterized protein YbaR (Trm112 family)